MPSEMPLEVEISIDKQSVEPLYVQLYEKLKSCILEGIIPEDYKLPPIRSLCEQLEINSITVVNAYKLLEESKLVYKKVGSGTYVMPLQDKINWEVNIQTAVEDVEYDMETGLSGEVINFANATPDPGLFPIADFKKAINEVLERDGGSAFMYHDSKGYKPLRAALSQYVDKYGLNVTAEDIYIISGAQQGIDIISKALLSNGDYVFVESPTYMGAIAAFKSRGAKIVEIPLLSDGMDMKELEKMLKLIKPKFIYSMPNFQNPTGITYSERKKKHLMLLSKKYDVRVVEDDYLSDLNYLDIKTLPLKAYDTENRVVYIKSFSKIFMPGLRVAYFIIPKCMREKVMSAKYMSDISTSGFMQRVLDVYIKSGIWDKHIEYMKKEYSLRYFEAVRAVKKYLRGASLYQPNGGINLWIKLPQGASATRLLAGCRARNVLFTPGTSFLKDNEGEHYMRLSFAGTSADKIIEGISIIGQVMEELRDK